MYIGRSASFEDGNLPPYFEAKLEVRKFASVVRSRCMQIVNKWEKGTGICMVGHIVGASHTGSKLPIEMILNHITLSLDP